MVIVLLRAKLDDATAVFAIVCSSWVAASRSTTQRSWVTPMGNTSFAKVRVANLQASRFLAHTSKEYIYSSPKRTLSGMIFLWGVMSSGISLIYMLRKNL